jgi:hypothetical protein
VNAIVRDFYLFDPQLFFDQLSQGVFDFRVPGNRGSAAIFRISVNVVAGSMVVQVATTTDKGTDELASFHTSTPNSRVLESACSGSGSDLSINR